MISFDPDYRITIEEATRHPFFDEGGAREGNLYTPINLDFSKESVPLNFDFEKLAQPSVRDIKQAFSDHFTHLHPVWHALGRVDVVPRIFWRASVHSVTYLG